MSSKRLESILSSVPPATAKGESINLDSRKNLSKDIKIEQTRIVATIPQILKDEIKSYIKEHKGETETTVVLRGLKKMGFSVNDAWLIDKRTTR